MSKSVKSEFLQKVEEITDMAEKEHRVMFLLTATEEGKESKLFIQGNQGQLVSFLAQAAKRSLDIKNILSDVLDELDKEEQTSVKNANANDTKVQG